MGTRGGIMGTRVSVWVWSRNEENRERGCLCGNEKGRDAEEDEEPEKRGERKEVLEDKGSRRYSFVPKQSWCELKLYAHFDNK